MLVRIWRNLRRNNQFLLAIDYEMEGKNIVELCRTVKKPQDTKKLLTIL